MKKTNNSKHRNMTIDEYEKMRKLVNPTLFERIKSIFHKPKSSFDFRKLL